MFFLLLFLYQEASKRRCVSTEDISFDFEADLTDLETFGETSNRSQPKKSKNQQDDGVKSQKATSASVVTRSKRSGEHYNANRSSQEDMKTPLINTENPTTESGLLSDSEAIPPKTIRVGLAEVEEEHRVFTGDSDDEKLIIDDFATSAATPTKQLQPQVTTCSADIPVTSAPESAPENIDSSPSHKGLKTRRQTKRAKYSGDQVGEILRMQTAMFKSANDTAASATKSPSHCVGLLLNSHPISLVKPCVTSYLERQQNEDGETSAVLHESAVLNANAAEQKS